MPHIRAIGIVILAGMGTVLGATGLAMAPRVVAAVDPDEAATQVADDLRAERAVLHARASTLAQLPRLAAAIATDEATVRDLTGDELAFRVHPNETIELSQQTQAGPRSLLRLPPDAAPLSLVAGTRFAVTGDYLVFTDTVPILGNGASGAISIAWRALPSEVFVQLGALSGAALVIGDKTVAIGPSRPEAGPTVAVGANAVASDATLVLPATETTTTAAIGFDMAAGLMWFAAVGLAVAGVFDRRRSTHATASLATASERTTTLIAAPEVAESRFGRYKPMRLLGEGGTSVVYLARSLGAEGFERLVALKVLREKLARDTRFRDMFLDEARLASKIAHPNVVQILDLGTSDSEMFIAMEHVDGDDLESILHYQRMDQRVTPMPVALTILRQLCDGLHAAHTTADEHGASLQLVHRDVKPGNLLISRNGEVKITDFGIVKATRQVHQTGVGSTSGTVQFMAPEQRTGARIDARADVFGVAAIAYELIAGRELNMDLQRLLVRGLAGWPHLEPITEVRPDAPHELQTIVFAALAYDREDRPETCAILEAELAAVMASRGWAASNRDVALWLREELALRDQPSTATSVESTMLVHRAAYAS